MKKKSLALVIMRITLVYAAIIFSLGTSMASNVIAQVALDKEITLNVANNEFSNVLNSIEKLSGVKFVYSSAIIESNRKITISANKRTISSVLNEILPQLNLAYEASGNSIIITRATTTAAPLVAQPVSGRVTDDKGETLIGVTVTEKGTRNATVTDINGNYRITVAGAASTLVFTYIGHSPVEVAVGGKSVVNATMTASVNALNDVVVTALGIKREAKKLGYSATTANTEELSATNRTTNVMGSLEGKVAGLVISPPSMGAGSSTRVRLRGQASLNGGNNSPLIVLNGLPLDQGAQSATNVNTRDFGDAFTQINQDDIETMTILKGSTAAALYGSRASNGAILITTKSGAKNQKFGVEFSSNFAADDALDYTRYQMVYGYGNPGSWNATTRSFQRPATVADAIQGGTNTWGVKYDGVPTIQFDGVLRPYLPNPNRISQFFRTGNTWTNSVALSGGNANTSYRMSFSNQDANGIAPNNDYHRKVFNLGLNSKIGDKLTLTFNTNYANEQNNNPPQGGQQGQGAANFLNRITPGYSLDVLRDNAVDPITGAERQTSGLNTTVLNPYYTLYSQFSRRTTDRILSTVTARYDFFKYLYLMGRANVDISTAFSESNTPSGVGSATLFNSDNSAYNGSYNLRNDKGTNTNYDFLLGTNNQKFGDFSAELTLGGNQRYDRSNNFTDGGTNFSIQNLYAIGNTVTKTVNYGIDRQKINSFYGVADFGYKSFLYLTVTDRVDYFSTLTPPSTLVANPKNSYNYPSVSGSFVFSELLPNVSWLNYGKLRASYAATGNAGNIGAFAGQLTYNLNPNPYTAANGQNYTIGNINGNSIPNPYLVPFGVTEKELGLEMRTLDSRLNFDITLYQKDTKNQIVPVNLSNATGYNLTNQNLASLRNRGIEILIDGTPIKKKDFSWNSSINGAYNESQVTDLGPGTQQLIATNFGTSGNEFLGKLVYEKGMALNQLEAHTYRKDAQGRDVVNTDGTLKGSVNDVIFGSADPKWTGGWTNTFRYKKVSLSVFIDYKFGGKMFSSTALNGLRQGLTQASLVGRDGITWPGVQFANNVVTSNPNTAVTNPQVFYTSYRGEQIADPFVFKSDFIKLRNISLSYDFSSLTRNIKYIKGLTISAFVRNVAILKKWVPDVDPEAFASSGDARLGYEQSTIPTTRTFGLNLNVKF